MCVSVIVIPQPIRASVSQCEICMCVYVCGGLGLGILNYWIHVQTLWSTECLCLCISAQSFYVPVVPSGIIYNSWQFYNSSFGAIYIDHRGCQSLAQNSDFSRVPLVFLLSAVVPIAWLHYSFCLSPLNKCDNSLKMRLKSTFSGPGSARLLIREQPKPRVSLSMELSWSVNSIPS